MRIALGIITTGLALMMVVLLDATTGDTGNGRQHATRMGHCTFSLRSISGAERATGFMHRAAVGDREALLFPLTDDTSSFWMKDTPTALTLTFLDGQGVVVSQRELTPFSLEEVTSDRHALYALETKTGVLQACGVRLGSKIELAVATSGPHQ